MFFSQNLSSFIERSVVPGNSEYRTKLRLSDGIGFLLAQIKIGRDMPVEKALRKFKSICKKEGIIDEVRKRRAYEKPSSRKRSKSRRRTGANSR